MSGGASAEKWESVEETSPSRPGVVTCRVLLMRDGAAVQTGPVFVGDAGHASTPELGAEAIEQTRRDAQREADRRNAAR